MQVSRLFTIAVAIALSAGVPSSARALTLADLDAGGSFSVGSLTFSDFDVSVAGDLSLDLADYPVQLLADGFRVSGPSPVLFGEEATVLVSYVVEAAAGAAINGAALFAPLVAAGPGAVGLVSDSLFDGDGDPIATLLALRVFGNGATLSDTASFAGTTQLQVAKVISLASGIVAAAPHVDQRFSVVPEPVTLVLMSAGLTGLAVAGRRRAMVA